MVKNKIYLNKLNDKALIINDRDKTFMFVNIGDLQQQVALYYITTLARMREVARIATARGYTRG